MKAKDISLTGSYQTAKAERISYSTFFCGQNIFCFLVVSFINVFLLDRGIDAVMVGIIVLAAKIWDGVNDPLIGILVDKLNFKPNKYLPWLRTAILLIPIATMLIFLMPVGLSYPAKIAWSITAFILWSTVYSMGDTPAFALITVISSNSLERSGIQSIARLFALVGIAVSMLGVPILQERFGWVPSALLLTAAATVLMVPLCFKVKERIKQKTEETPSFKEIFSQLGQNKYLLIFMSSLFIGNVFQVFNVMAPIFTKFIWHDFRMTALLSAAILIPSLIIAPFIARFLKRLDKVQLYLISLVASIIVSVIIFFVGYDNKPLVVALYFLRGIASVPSGILIFQFTPDCAEYGTYKTGIRAEGASFSLQTLVINIAGAVCSGAAMIIIAGFGFVSDDTVIQAAPAAMAIWSFITWVPAAGNCVQLLIMSLFYKLRDKDIQLMIKCNSGEITKSECAAKLSIKI